MIKIFFIIIIFLFLNNCSLNPNSKFWNENSKNMNINQNDDNKNNSIEIVSGSYKKIKKEIIEYGKNKDFPDINN